MQQSEIAVGGRKSVLWVWTVVIGARRRVRALTVGLEVLGYDAQCDGYCVKVAVLSVVGVGARSRVLWGE